MGVATEAAIFAPWRMIRARLERALRRGSVVGCICKMLGSAMQIANGF
jgi:hypothetical protein